MNDRIRGFTLVEVLVAIVLGAALIGIAVRSFAPAQRAIAVRSAARTFAAMHARARAHAVEGGETTVLNIDIAADRVWIQRGPQRLESLDFDEAMKVDLQAAVPSLTVCMNSRGFADTDCSSVKTITQLSFLQRGESAAVTLLPLGQLNTP